MVVFHVSTFILQLQTAGGYDLVKLTCSNIFCQQVTGVNISTVAVYYGHTVVGVIGAVTVSYHIIDSIGLNAAADAVTVGSGFNEVGVVIVFQKSFQ